jgi:hypothetical protein
MARRITTYLRNNVLGLTALFIALGAGAYAAGLPKNSVKSKQIKAGAVKTDELANDSVTGDKVGPDALTGADIAQLGAGDIGELSGANLPIRWAFVEDDGTILQQSGGITLGHHPSAGVYRINFGTDLTKYAILANTWQAGEIATGICGQGDAPQTDCLSSPGANTTSVADLATFNSVGALANRRFYVVAIP